MYEILKAHENSGKYTVEVSDLRSILYLDNELTRWSDFKKNVLDKAQNELPAKTDLGFSYTAIKRGRSYHRIRFKIWPTKAKEQPSSVTRNLQRKARACYRGLLGNCSAPWHAYGHRPGEICHWCQKFEHRRAEADGQKTLPGMV